MAFSQQRWDRPHDEKQQQPCRKAGDVQGQEQGGQDQLNQGADHLDHGDSIRRLCFGAFQSIVILGILKSSDIELRCVFHDTHADMLQVEITQKAVAKSHATAQDRCQRGKPEFQCDDPPKI